jgi:hypothetical protein
MEFFLRIFIADDFWKTLTDGRSISASTTLSQIIFSCSTLPETHCIFLLWLRPSVRPIPQNKESLITRLNSAYRGWTLASAYITTCGGISVYPYYQLPESLPNYFYFGHTHRELHRRRWVLIPIAGIRIFFSESIEFIAIAVTYRIRLAVCGSYQLNS